MRAQTYPQYKDSGIEWLGQIPVHWEVTRLKLVSRLHTGGTPAGLADDAFDESGIPWVKPDDLLGDRGMRQPEKAVTPEAARGIGAVPKGSALICGIGTVGKFGYALAEICTNQQINSAVFGKRFVPRFGQFVVWGLQSEFESHSNKVTIAICNKASMGLARLAIPPRAEQQAIADFLDRETAKIDALVEKKERLIELLQEKRIALITHAVTKGLDPNVPMRDSGVEWLGQIPAHWAVKRLRYLGEAIIGLTFSPADIADKDDGILLLRASNVSDTRIILKDNVFVSCAIPERLVIRVGDILICSRSGSRALIGKNAMIDEESAGLTFGVFMMVFRSPSNAYLFHVFNSRLFDYQSSAFLTSTINQLTIANLNSFKVPLPPPREQKAIADFLDRETAKIDALIAKVGEAIERLKEYRTALISAAVTGKIDVRGFVEDRDAGTE